MDKTQFEQLTVGNLVYFTKRHEDMPHGWNAAMDKLIGKPLVIIHKGGKSVRVTKKLNLDEAKMGIAHPNYTATYPYLEIWEEIKVEPWSTKIYTYKTKKPLSIPELKRVCYDNTYGDLVNALSSFTNNEQVIIDEKVFKFLYTKFPFVICYAVAHDILSREPCLQ